MLLRLLVAKTLVKLFQQESSWWSLPYKQLLKGFHYKYFYLDKATSLKIFIITHSSFKNIFVVKLKVVTNYSVTTFLWCLATFYSHRARPPTTIGARALLPCPGLQQQIGDRFLRQPHSFNSRVCYTLRVSLSCFLELFAPLLSRILSYRYRLPTAYLFIQKSRYR
jgi:hypothetical protein